MRLPLLFALGLTLTLTTANARAYTCQTAITKGCHEAITAAVVRSIREQGFYAPVAPTADERALLDDLAFDLPDDLHDMIGYATIAAVREVDFGGHSPADAELVTVVQNDPTTQSHHCLRTADQDEPNGAEEALADCRAFLRGEALAAADAIDENGNPRAGMVEDLSTHLEIRGDVKVPLAAAAVHLGTAMHTIEDGFSHTFRTSPKDESITQILNFVDQQVGEEHPATDGPAHERGLDACTDIDAYRQARLDIATTAAADLALAVVSAKGDHAVAATQVDAVLDAYFTFTPGCTNANTWCDAPELAYQDKGCGCVVAKSAPGGTRSAAIFCLLPLAMIARRRRRLAALLGFGPPLIAATIARADNPPSNDTSAASAAAHAAAVAASATTLKQARQAASAAASAASAAASAEGAPTPNDVLPPEAAGASRVGAAAAVGASVNSPALLGRLGVRVRLDDRWSVGADAEWNPFFAFTKSTFRSGVANFFLTGIHRYPIATKKNFVSKLALRTTLHVGVSTLLFDLYGAPKGSTGLFVGGSFLGLDLQLGRGFMLVVDPVEIGVPIPKLNGIPFAYEQYRFVVGLQWGG